MPLGGPEYILDSCSGWGILGRLPWEMLGEVGLNCSGNRPGSHIDFQGDLVHMLDSISGDCLGESLERSCKMRCGSRNVLWGVLWRFHTKSLGVLDKSLGDSSGNVIKLLGCPGQTRNAFLGS